MDEPVILQSVAAQYGVLPAAQREMPWPEWSTLVAGLTDQTALGHLVQLRTLRDPEALRRLTPWQKQVRSRWQRFLAGRATRSGQDLQAARSRQQSLQRRLARLFS